MRRVNDEDQQGNLDEMIRAVILETRGLLQSLCQLKKASQTCIGKWNVYESSGFWKACRRINKKVNTIHIGRTFHRGKATAKILEWEAKNLPPGGGSVPDTDLVEEENSVDTDLVTDEETAVDEKPINLGGES
jgi:hypothetical protein